MKATQKDSIRSYLAEISRVPLLSSEQEIQLGRKIQKLQFLLSSEEKLKVELRREPSKSEWSEKANCSIFTLERDLAVGKKAKEQLVIANLRLVVSIAKKYQHRGLELLDLVQEGNTGLILAAEKFQPQRGCKFSTVAYWWIRQAIVRAIQFHSRTIRLPTHAYEILNKIKKATQKLSSEKGRTPNLTEIAEYLDENPEIVRFYLKAARLPTSLDRTVGEDEDSNLGQFLEDKSAQPLELLLKNEAPERMAELFRDLKPQERKVLVLRYGLNSEPQSHQKIATQLGVSKQAIGQKEKKAIAKLQKTWKDKTASYF